ncbi:MAG: helix-turn-helix domain-containing protein [Deltaproteobacteria bacterium]|nr:helix-turn-helix domain-containing protein [Deltaproteobacteria bacterium]
MRKTSKLSVNEVATDLGISPFTVRRWVAERKIAFFKVGGRIVFDRRDIDALLVRSRVEPVELKREDAMNGL